MVEGENNDDGEVVPERSSITDRMIALSSYLMVYCRECGNVIFSDEYDWDVEMEEGVLSHELKISTKSHVCYDG